MFNSSGSLTDAQRKHELGLIARALRQQISWQRELYADGYPHADPEELHALDARIARARQQLIAGHLAPQPHHDATPDNSNSTSAASSPAPDAPAPSSPPQHDVPFFRRGASRKAKQAPPPKDSVVQGHVYKFSKLSGTGRGAARASRRQASNTPGDPRQQLEALYLKWDNCNNCNLCHSRRSIVSGVGSVGARLMLIGEAPGVNEDRQGKPFVGKSGQLLSRMITAMTLSREQVYLCHIVKCRPPGNRTPSLDEVKACQPFLEEQIAIVQPEVIVTLGETAAQFLLKTNSPLKKLRGNWQHVGRTRVMPTLHPDHLLRNPGDKRVVWQDLQSVMSALSLVR